jgi:hypothetical protein
MQSKPRGKRNNQTFTEPSGYLPRRAQDQSLQSEMRPMIGQTAIQTFFSHLGESAKLSRRGRATQGRLGRSRAASHGETRLPSFQVLVQVTVNALVPVHRNAAVLGH